MVDAIISRWECPSCGGIINSKCVLENKGTKYSFTNPRGKCACGRKGSFRLLNFEPGNVVIINNNTEVIPVPSKHYEDMYRLVSSKLNEMPKIEEETKLDEEKENDN